MNGFVRTRLYHRESVAVEVRALADLRTALLADRPTRQLCPDEGEEAFRQHKILAAAVHRATRLDERCSDPSDTFTWVRYFENYFPEPRNDPEAARDLFGHWRTDLVKDHITGQTISVTHRQSHLHWVRVNGRLVLNLESMWDDFATSVDAFIDALRAKRDRREIVLKRWRERTYVIEYVSPTSLPVGTVMSLSSAQSITAAPLPPKL
jgi:hypothetical protein